MRQLLKNIKDIRRNPHFEDLRLGLAVPFCILENPWEAAELLEGRTKCGPFASLVVDPSGRLIRCYSRRRGLSYEKGIRAAAITAAILDFEELPECCQCCPMGIRCLGGCRCESTLAKNGLDYLAHPEHSLYWTHNLSRILPL
jgi:radical SAM protein with 4Fe4S-binding SPASM domain